MFSEFPIAIVVRPEERRKHQSLDFFPYSSEIRIIPDIGKRELKQS